MATSAATAPLAHHHHDHHGDEEHPPPTVWSARMPVGLIGMLFFIGSEIALFGSFFMAFVLIRLQAQGTEYSTWAAQIGTHLPLDVVTFNSLILFTSSVTIHYAEIALTRGARRWQAIWLGATLVLGLTFLSIQILEYTDLVGVESLGPSTSAYSSVFYALTGLHGSHVLIGAILLTIMLVRTLRGHYSPDPDQHVGFRTMSIYWHFVDVVWIFVFSIIYLPGNIDRWGDYMWVFLGGAAVILALMFLPSFIGKGARKHTHA